MHNIEDFRQKRQSSYESEIGSLCYERFRLCRQMDIAASRIGEKDTLIANCESALRESEAMRRDLATQEAIAVAIATLNENGG